MAKTVRPFTCLRSMKASWSVSPWKPGTGSELANTEKKQRHQQHVTGSTLMCSKQNTTDFYDVLFVSRRVSCMLYPGITRPP